MTQIVHGPNRGRGHGQALQRVAVVTGSGSGIGLESARLLAETGWHVVGLDRDRAAQRELAAELGAAFSAVMGDVAHRATHERAADVAEAHGRLEGWVNSAGVELPDSALDLRRGTLTTTINVNVVGYAYGCSVAIQRFVASETPGGIVNVGSIHAVAGFPNALSYQISKGAVSALTRQLAVEFGPRGIRTNVVLPGVVMTGMTQRALDRAPDRAEEIRLYRELHPMGRPAEAKEIAAVVVFLLGPGASFVNGAEVPVDGGATARVFAWPAVKPGEQRAE
jgi:NAD(P)-dependent dehydrogenase (short-subunit alcohol dehydrogenase family)